MKNFRLFASLATMAAVAIGLVATVLWQLGYFRQHRQWRLATGDPSGNYHQLGKQLADLFHNSPDSNQKFQLLQSGGSAENMDWIETGAADFAFVQSNADVSPNARLVATLYDEVLHILVRAELLDDEANSPEMALEKLGSFEKVSLGPRGSGTSEVAEMLLDHFEVQLSSPPLHQSTTDLKKLFAAGELDAAFVLAAPGSPHTKALLDQPEVQLLSLGEGPPGGTPVDAFAMLHPSFHTSLIPARLYGRQPRRSVHTVGVSALLVASEAADFNVVRQVTRRLFGYRNQLVVGEDTPLQLTPSTANSRASVPLHAGAEAFYHRENPSFLVVYAEVIALGITMLVGVWSILRLFFRWLADVKKERIDQFYRDVREAAKLDGQERLAALRAIHERAFDQLMSERLVANESFVILHDYLLSEIARAERTS